MLFPEIILYKTINSFINLVNQNYIDTTDKSKTILSDIFNEVAFEIKDNMLKIAIDLFSRNDENVNKLEVNIGYNRERANFPNIHILLPSETKGVMDSLGNNEGANPSNILEGDGDDQQLIVSKTKSKRAVYHLMITSINVYEVIVIYYFLHAVFLMFDDHFELSGFRNLNCSGADINLQNDLSLPNIYHRNLTLQFDYEYKVKTRFKANLISKFNFKVCADFADDNLKYLEGLEK